MITSVEVAVLDDILDGGWAAEAKDSASGPVKLEIAVGVKQLIRVANGNENIVGNRIDVCLVE